MEKKKEAITFGGAIGRIFAVSLFIFIIAAIIWPILGNEWLVWTLTAFIAVLVEEISFYLLEGISLTLWISCLFHIELTPEEKAAEAARAELEKENESLLPPLGDSGKV